jgi:hypothetical protein
MVRTSTGWSATPLPEPGERSFLTAVAAISPHEAIAAGWTASGPMIDHWNGTAWTAVPLPPLVPGLHGAGLAAVSAAPGCAVAVGGGFDPEAVTEQPLLYRRDGNGWQRDALPELGEPYVLTGVAMISATEGWAVGHAFPGPVVLRWDGVHWINVPVPDPGHAKLLAVTVRGSEVWAVGAQVRKPFALHYDGRTWRQTKCPASGPVTAVVSGTSGVWAASGRDLMRWTGRKWAGIKGITPANALAAAEGLWVAGAGGLAHYDGRRWTPQEMPDGTWLGVATRQGTVWAVGSRTLIETETDLPTMPVQASS